MLAYLEMFWNYNKLNKLSIAIQTEVQYSFSLQSFQISNPLI